MGVSLCCLVGSLLALGGSSSVVPSAEFPGTDPGTAIARMDGARLVLHNAVVSATWELEADRFGLVELANRMSGTTIRPCGEHEAFVVTLEGGRSIKASEFQRVGKPKLERIEPDGGAVRLSHRLPVGRPACHWFRATAVST